MITLELPAQTYVAKGRLFLFVKCMAAPGLHTVKTGRTGPKNLVLHDWIRRPYIC